MVDGEIEGSEFEIFNVDRPRGLLTPTDREYLLGGSDIEEKSQQERNRRAAIRERLYHGLLDFVLLNYMENRDRASVFTAEEGREPKESKKVASLEQGVIATLGFLYGELKKGPFESFQDYLEEGVVQSEATEDEDGTLRFRPYKVTLEVEEPEEPSVYEVAKEVQRSLHYLSEEEHEELIALLQKTKNRDEVSEEVLSALREGSNTTDAKPDKG